MVDDLGLAEVLSDFAVEPAHGFFDRSHSRSPCHPDRRRPADLGRGRHADQGRRPRRYIAASDAAALVFEQLQSDIGEGPCLATFETGDAVTVPDLRVPSASHGSDRRRSAVALPWCSPFRCATAAEDWACSTSIAYTPGALDDRGMRAAQTLADVTAADPGQTRRLATMHVRETERVYEGSLHDSLTGLANRLALQARLDHARRRAMRSHADAAVLFIDLDDFKSVNDTHGHLVGDELLIAVGQRLLESVRPGDTCARLSGDEFVLLCEDLEQARDVELVADRIDKAFAAPFVILGERDLHHGERRHRVRRTGRIRLRKGHQRCGCGHVRGQAPGQDGRTSSTYVISSEAQRVEHDARTLAPFVTEP